MTWRVSQHACDRWIERIDNTVTDTWVARYRFQSSIKDTFIVPNRLALTFWGKKVYAKRVARGRKVASGVKAIVVPGSQQVLRAAEEEGLHEIFREAGFEWRGAGCSMCLAMNPDKLQGRQLCASSSNRNFKGRQGSPTGRTLLMSPAMVAAAAVNGAVVDVRELLS